MKSSFAIVAALLLPLSAAAKADDDRPAGPRELSGAAKMLMSAGFTHTQKVKFKNSGAIEFKGVRHASGQKFDVKVRNGRIVEIGDD